MALLPGNVDAEYGISKTLSGYTIEDVRVVDTPVFENVPDQKNRVAKVLHVDTRYDLTMTVRGSSKPSVDNAFTYDGKNWILESVEDAGVYNGLRRFNIKAFRFKNCSQKTNIA